MKKISFLLFLIFLSLSFNNPLDKDIKMEARVYFKNLSDLYQRLGDLFGELDIATRDENEKGESYLVIITNQEQLEQIKGKGLRIEITYSDIKDKFREMTGVDPDNLDMLRDFGYFFTYWEVIDTLTQLNSNFSSITQVFNIGNSYQGRPLWTLKISDNPLIDEPEPAVYINGATHAREPGATHCCIDFATYILANYGQDSIINWLVRNREIYITPVMNPDGYVYNSDSGGATSNWRKNRRIIVAPNIGVDLNRNYGYRWGVDNIGSSPNPWSTTYRGPAPFSEPETQVARDFMLNQKIRTQIDYHTYGQYNMYPWAYSTIAPPESLILKEIVDTFRLYNQYSASRTGQGSRVLYFSNGCSKDWEHADTLWQGNQKFITYSTSIEWGRTDFWYGWNRPAYVDSECVRNRPNNIYLTRVAGVFFEPRAAIINDSILGNSTGQLDPDETSDIWVKLRNRAVHPLDSAYQITSKLKSLDTMIVILDSIKTFPTCLRTDSTDNRLQQFRIFALPGANPGRVCTLRLEMSYKDDTLTMMQPVNFIITIGSNPILTHDVGCIKIEGIPAMIDSGLIITPACSVYNYGTATENYTVRMKIGNLYNDTASVISHAPGTFRYVTFASWTAMQRGNQVIRCSTELIGDRQNNNDQQIDSVFILVLDVGTTIIISPPAVVDSGVTVTPQARVKNFGNTTETNIPVRFNIGSWQDDTMITILAVNESTLVTFANWTATQRGIFTKKCSTRLIGDLNPINDKQTGSVSVGVQDVGIVSLVLPDTVNSGTIITPACSLFNYGTSAETYNVIMKYNGNNPETLDVTSHPPASYFYLEFSSQVIQPGANIFSCSLAINDMNPTNDTMSKNVFGGSFDVGVTKITEPIGIIPPGIVITPACSVYNYGNIAETYSIRMKIGTLYDNTTTVFNHQPGTSVFITFPDWYANQPGNYVVSCSTQLTGDMNPSNDKQTDTVNVFQITQNLWELMAQIPPGLSGKRPKSGSSMAGLDGKIYFLKASNTQDFYVYTPDMGLGTWVDAETIPIGTRDDGDGKKPKKGAAIAAYEPGKCIYTLRGNNTIGFWRFQPDSTGGLGEWTKLQNIPEGTRRVKYGSGLVAVTKAGNDYLFAMKGSKTNEFYLYDITNNFWNQVSSPPIGTSGKFGYKKGSCLCYDDNEYVYVLQGYYGSFFKYNIEGDSWIQLRQYNYKTFLNRDGKKKKPKDGAGLTYHNNMVYMLKGGNTNEFWMYDILADTWIQLGPVDVWDIPFGPSRKKVKGGGALTQLDNYFYVSKGKNTDEFYCHIMPMSEIAINPKPTPTNEGVMSDKRLTGEYILTIVPNPVINITAIRYNLPKAEPIKIKLYNVAGSLIKLYTNSTPTKEGIINIDMKEISSGVYILRFDSEQYKTTRKLIVGK